jgi:hypothetical protein
MYGYAVSDMLPNGWILSYEFTNWSKKNGTYGAYFSLVWTGAMLSLTRSPARSHVSEDSYRQIRTSSDRWSLSSWVFKSFRLYSASIVQYSTTYLVLGRAPCFQGPRAEMLLWSTSIIIFAPLIFRLTISCLLEFWSWLMTF